MPIPKYTAIALETFALLGGSTLPSIMTVQDEQGEIIGTYVVKVFKQRNIKQYQPTNKEVYCYVLAKEFELPIPHGALIYVNEDIIYELKQQPSYADFNLKEGYYFGTAYLDNTTVFQSEISDKLLSNGLSQLENIFAFDILIRNLDRNVNKPNLIVVNQEPVLIDHELALNIQKPFNEYIERRLWTVLTIGKKKHILLDTLRKNNLDKPIEFSEFFEYLRYLQLKPLEDSAELLKNHEQEISDFQLIYEYLNQVKRNIGAFKKLLSQLINE